MARAVRISGIDLPINKKVEVALTYIYGVGLPRSQKIMKETGIELTKRVKDLSENEISLLQNAVSKFVVEGDLRRQVSLDIKRLIDIGSYRGQRHRTNLSVRGQRTKTNCRTRRGVRKTVANKKVAASKT